MKSGHSLPQRTNLRKHLQLHRTVCIFEVQMNKILVLIHGGRFEKVHFLRTEIEQTSERIFVRFRDQIYGSAAVSDLSEKTIIIRPIVIKRPNLCHLQS